MPKFLCNRIIFSKQCVLVFSQELIDEFLDVSKRPKLRRFFSNSDIESILETIEDYAEFINVETKIETFRDPKDNFLLSLSVDRNADFLKVIRSQISKRFTQIFVKKKAAIYIAAFYHCLILFS